MKILLTLLSIILATEFSNAQTYDSVSVSVKIKSIKKVIRYENPRDSCYLFFNRNSYLTFLANVIKPSYQGQLNEEILNKEFQYLKYNEKNDTIFCKSGNSTLIHLNEFGIQELKNGNALIFDYTDSKWIINYYHIHAFGKKYTEDTFYPYNKINPFFFLGFYTEELQMEIIK